MGIIILSKNMFVCLKTVCHRYFILDFNFSKLRATIILETYWDLAMSFVKATLTLQTIENHWFTYTSCNAILFQENLVPFLVYAKH